MKYVYELYNEEKEDVIEIRVSFGHDKNTKITDAQAYQRLENMIGKELAKKCELISIDGEFR